MDGYRWIFDLQKLGVMDGYKCNQFSQTWFMFVLQTQVFNGITYIYNIIRKNGQTDRPNVFEATNMKVASRN